MVTPIKNALLSLVLLCYIAHKFSNYLYCQDHFALEVEVGMVYGALHARHALVAIKQT